MPADFFDTLSAGERIVVRYRLDGSANETRFSDVLGEFVGFRPGAIAGVSTGATGSSGHGVDAVVVDAVVVVRSRSGDVRVRRSSVTHAKRVPPAPARRRPSA